ncbi:MAG: SIMPL domain-containing protein [Nitrospirae bacterium]|nr:SIMPL domain-containing protein [Nitrospirota bacterium]
MKRRWVMQLGAVVGICVWASAGAWAQELGDRPFPPQIRVTAEASIEARPDRATIDLGVVTEAATAQTAGAQNAKRVEAVLASLRAVLSASPGGTPGGSTAGSESEITTIAYALDPVYTRPKPGGAAIISGYSASNVVRVTTDDLSQVGRLIDGAMGAGANRVNRLVFALKDDQPLVTRALEQASVRAKSKAEAIAAALGVKIVRVLQVEENGPAVRPVESMLRFSAAAEPATPVEPGTVDVTATVTLTVEIGK